MGLRINTNIPALTAQRNLAAVTDRLAATMRRLSTGLRINSAADDPAGLAMSERLRAQVRSIDQARRNAQDGISLAQTGEGALNEVSSMLTRLRELAVQSANGTLSSQDRSTLQDEFSSLVSEIDRIAQSTEFNGIRLLDGSTTTVTFQVGAGTSASDGISVQLSAALSSDLGLGTADIGTLPDVSFAINAVDGAINSVAALRGRLGAVQSRLGYASDYLGIQSENLAAADSRIRDADTAFEAAQLAKLQILQQASIAVLAQANSQPNLALRLITGQ
ncbi:MAG: flagellin [Planctomycetota bacterium]